VYAPKTVAIDKQLMRNNKNDFIVLKIRTKSTPLSRWAFIGSKKNEIDKIEIAIAID
jgi:hypothetical protein